MKIEINATADLNLPEPCPALLQIEAATLPGGAQTVQESALTVEPQTDSETFTDFYGNGCRRLRMPGGDVRVTYHAVVEQPDGRAPILERVEPDPLHLPTDTLLYLLPSRYCPSDRLVNMAGEMFGQIEPGFNRVQAICLWINQHIRYGYGTSDAATTALDTVIQRQGVCRDFAHLGVSFCRALNIPARYVSGYCLGLDPPDFHAYFHAFLDGRWVAFDATDAQPRRALVQVAVGRDAADCAWSTFYGQGQTKALEVLVTEIL